MLEFDDPHWLTGSIFVHHPFAENHKGVIDVQEKRVIPRSLNSKIQSFSNFA